MYCKTCEADVAAEVSADGKSLLCTTCGSEVRKSYAPSLSDEAKSARELLERWSSEDEPDPFADAGSAAGNDRSGQRADVDPAGKPQAGEHTAGDRTGGDRNGGDFASNIPAADAPPAQQPPSKKPGAIQRTDVSETLSGPKIRPRRGAQPPKSPPTFDTADGDLMERPRRPDDRRPSRAVERTEPAEPVRREPPSPVDAKSKKVFRIDAAHTRAVEAGNDGPNVPPPHRRPAPAMPDGHRLDARHDIPAPHMRTESFVPPKGKKPGKVESVAGQLLAYGGVGLLTVGTALILWGYFGGPVRYAPTGWLVATVGQMILLLGVVTLISGGMQQTTHEVGMRVADLGQRLGRIEETTEMALSAPHFMSDRQRDTERAAVGVDRRDEDAFE